MPTVLVDGSVVEVIYCRSVWKPGMVGLRALRVAGLSLNISQDAEAYQRREAG